MCFNLLGVCEHLNFILFYCVNGENGYVCVWWKRPLGFSQQKSAVAMAMHILATTGNGIIERIGMHMHLYLLKCK